MTATFFPGASNVAAPRKESFGRGRIEFKAPPSWIERATREGERLGLNLSSFIRLVITQYLDRVEAERETRPKK
jgi:hypothetical protein